MGGNNCLAFTSDGVTYHFFFHAPFVIIITVVFETRPVSLTSFFIFLFGSLQWVFQPLFYQPYWEVCWSVPVTITICCCWRVWAEGILFEDGCARNSVVLPPHRSMLWLSMYACGDTIMNANRMLPPALAALFFVCLALLFRCKIACLLRCCRYDLMIWRGAYLMIAFSCAWDYILLHIGLGDNTLDLYTEW